MFTTSVSQSHIGRLIQMLGRANKVGKCWDLLKISIPAALERHQPGPDFVCTKDMCKLCARTRGWIHQQRKVIYIFWGCAYHFSALMCPPPVPCAQLAHVFCVHEIRGATKQGPPDNPRWEIAYF